MSRRFNKYSKETKLKAVKRYLNDGLSYQAVADEMGIKSKTQVDRWVKKFKKSGDTAFDCEKRGRIKGFSPKPKKSKGEFSSLEEENIHALSSSITSPVQKILNVLRSSLFIWLFSNFICSSFACLFKSTLEIFEEKFLLSN